MMSPNQRAPDILINKYETLSRFALYNISLFGNINNSKVASRNICHENQNNSPSRLLFKGNS